MLKNSKISVILLCFLLVTSLCFFVPRHHEHKVTSARDFDSFTFSLFQQELCSNTLNLHYTVSHPQNYGILDYPVTLGNYSADTNTQKESIQHLLFQLQQFNPTTLSQKQKYTYDLLLDYFNNQLKLTDYSLYSQPLGPSLGVQAQLPVLLAEYTFYTRQDIEDYLELLRQIPSYFDSVLFYETQQAKAGLFLCENTLNAIQEQCKAFAASQENNLLIENFPSQLSQLSATILSKDTKELSDTVLDETQTASYIEQQKQIVIQIVCPAYEKLSNSLEKLRPYCTNYNGLSSFPSGKQYYQLLVQTSVGTDKTIEEIRHAISDKLTAIQSENAKIILNKKDILEQLNTASIFPEKPEEILTVLQERIADDFPPVPSSHFHIKTVSPTLSDFLSPAFYLTPPIDNLHQNTIYINDSKVKDSLSLFPTLAHEGYPGHLYQTTCFGNTNPDPIRYLLSYPGYTEGWATYVELYSYSISGLDDNLAVLLKNNTIFTLGLYCLADIGIHYDGWNLPKTVSFFGEYGITDLNTVTQIYDIILSEPGNYLRYFVGYLEFEECYETYQNALGSHASLKDFHARVLNIGPCPFYMLRKWVMEWGN